MLRRDQVPGTLLSWFREMEKRKNLPQNYSETNGDPADSLDDAELVSSKLRRNLSGNDEHLIALDIDVPAWLIPSSTPGHSHLYIQKVLTWPEYEKLLIALAEAGVIEDGYKNVSIRRKATFLRLPWIRKGQEKVSAAVQTLGGIEKFLEEEESDDDPEKVTFGDVVF